jgi:hypothetical protein
VTSQLSLYNQALQFIGQTRISSLAENSEARYLLDTVWSGGGIRRCLEAGQWRFATRTVQIEYDPSIEPNFGYQYAFQKPTDWVRTVSLSADEYFNTPLNQYRDEAGYWWSDIQPLYVGFVSDSSSYGGDLSLWPESFTEYAASYFGVRIAPNISGAVGRIADLKKESKDLLRAAQSNDAMNGPSPTMPRGSWSRSRQSRTNLNDYPGSTLTSS